MLDDDNRRIHDPSYIILVLIGLGTIGLIIHGETLVPVPRCHHIYEIETETGEEWLIPDLAEIEAIKLPNYEASEDPFWEPPCLPNESPEALISELEELEEWLEEEVSQVDNIDDWDGFEEWLEEEMLLEEIEEKLMEIEEYDGYEWFYEDEYYYDYYDESYDY